ncbi:MAG: hypothetical protein AB1578_17915 [Thermodesulfobacteriota bacterium]
MASWGVGALMALLLWAGIGEAGPGGGAGDPTPQLVVARLEAAWEAVRDYRALLVSTAWVGVAPPERTTLRYWFQKPDRLRLEFISPRAGLVLVYPYRPDGPQGEPRARVQPGGFLRFLRLTLDPGSPRLAVAPGQGVDQTDLGLLVRNIARSLTAEARSPPVLREYRDHLVAAVEAEAHFLRGVPARYEFRIDRALWLPVGVREELPERGWVREVVFQDLDVNPGFPEDLFRLE